MKRLSVLAVLVVLGATALVVAVTSGGASGSGAGARTRAVLGLRSTALGSILVGAKSRTLYLFEADPANKSNCSGACASVWPPFTSAGRPLARGGAAASNVATIAIGGGKRQVTYKGHPLYYYAGDQKPGVTSGQGLRQFGAAWYVLAPSGHKIDND
ncbi:MAG: hypothetical protein M3P44_12050 [Actinomycetota bacterium]|nr:hypothetical protein [Actinomycetota bacterium]